MIYDLVMQTFEQMKSQLASNDFMAAGAMFAALGSIWYWARSLPMKLYIFVKDKVTYSVEFLDHDPAYFWVSSYIADNYETLLKFPRRFTALATHDGIPVSAGSRVFDGNRNNEVTEAALNNLIGAQSSQYDDGDYPFLDDDAPKATKGSRDGTILTPSPGKHLMRFKRAWMLLGHQRISGERDGAATYREELTLHCMIWRKKTITDLIDIARKEIVVESDNRPYIYHVNNFHGGNWSMSGRGNLRSLDSVLLQHGLGSTLLRSLQSFYSKRKWYTDRGIPWRMGVGLTGPPGNGKTSLICALANTLNKSLCSLSLASSGMNDDALNELLMSRNVKNALVVIEDIDCVQDSRVDEDEDEPEYKTGYAKNKAYKLQNKSKVTLSGLLNALDGLNDGDGRVVIMTTNFPERLDPALRRPGRMDQVLRLDNADLVQIEAMFVRFFPDSSAMPLRAPFFASHWKDVDSQYSMAQVQQYLMQYADASDEAASAANVKAYLAKTKPNMWTQQDYYASKNNIQASDKASEEAKSGQVDDTDDSVSSDDTQVEDAVNSDVSSTIESTV